MSIIILVYCFAVIVFGAKEYIVKTRKRFLCKVKTQGSLIRINRSGHRKKKILTPVYSFEYEGHRNGAESKDDMTIMCLKA